jgi:hypothetical protein
MRHTFGNLEATVGERLGGIGRYLEHAEAVNLAREALTVAEARLARSIREVGADPAGLRPYWSDVDEPADD